MSQRERPLIPLPLPLPLPETRRHTARRGVQCQTCCRVDLGAEHLFPRHLTLAWHHAAAGRVCQLVACYFVRTLDSSGCRTAATSAPLDVVPDHTHPPRWTRALQVPSSLSTNEHCLLSGLMRCSSDEPKQAGTHANQKLFC